MKTSAAITIAVEFRTGGVRNIPLDNGQRAALSDFLGLVDVDLSTTRQITISAPQGPVVELVDNDEPVSNPLRHRSPYQPATAMSDDEGPSLELIESDHSFEDDGKDDSYLSWSDYADEGVVVETFESEDDDFNTDQHPFPELPVPLEEEQAPLPGGRLALEYFGPMEEPAGFSVVSQSSHPAHHRHDRDLPHQERDHHHEHDHHRHEHDRYHQERDRRHERERRRQARERRRQAREQRQLHQRRRMPRIHSRTSPPASPQLEGFRRPATAENQNMSSEPHRSRSQPRQAPTRLNIEPDWKLYKRLDTALSQENLRSDHLYLDDTDFPEQKTEIDEDFQRDRQYEPMSYSFVEKSKIYEVCRSGSLDELKEVVAEDPRALYSCDRFGASVVHLACSHTAKFEVLQWLVSVRYIRIDSRDAFHRIPLHRAAENDRLDCVQFLLKEMDFIGLDVDTTDRGLKTALHTACMFGFTQIAAHLIKNGANVHALAGNREAPLQMASHRMELSTMRILVENFADVHYRTKYVASGMEFAEDRGFGNFLRNLIAKRAKLRKELVVLLSGYLPDVLAVVVIEFNCGEAHF